MQDFAAPTTTEPTAPPTTPTAPVRVVRRDGRVYEADTPEQAAALLDARDPATGEALYDLDTPERAEERRLQREYGGRDVAAGAAGLARGATLGLSDVALSESGLVSGETLRELAERNALASGAGELGGALAPLLFSGGTSALARGGLEGAALAAEGAGATRAGGGLLRSLLRGVTAPSRLVTGAAEAAEARTLAALGTEGAATFGRRALGRAASTGVAGTIEGAGLGVQQSLTESVFENRALTAEQVLANVGLNALLGGAAGGVLGTGVEGLLTGARGTRDVVSRAFRDAIGVDLRRGVAEAWEHGSRAIGRASSLATGADEAAIARAIGPDGADLRALAARGDAVYEDATRELTPMLSEVETGARHTQDFWGRVMKPDQVRRIVASERIGDQFREAATRVGRVRQMAEQVIADARAGTTFEAAGVGTRARDLLASVTAAEQMIASASGRGARGQFRRMADPQAVSAQLFTALDEMKRGIGRVQDRIESVDRGSSFLQQLRGEDGYEGIRRSLEDSSMWGGAADAQRDVNRAYTRMLEQRRRYVREFLGHTERDTIDPFREIAQADSARIDAFVRSTGAARNDTRAQVFRDVLDAQADLMETMSRHLDLGDVAAEAQRSASGARAARAAFDALEDRVARVNQFKALESGTGVERALVAQGAGFVLGGPIGAAIATALASPATLARGLGAIERAAARVTLRVDRGVSSYVGRALDAARRGAGMARRVTRAAARKAIVRTSSERFDEEVERVIEAATHPEQTQERIAESTRDVGEAAPEVQRAMQEQAQRGVAFLARRIPAAARPVNGIMPGMGGRRREASSPERARFLRYAAAVNDPLAVLDQLDAGAMPPESVEVLRELFPQIHQQIGNAFVSELARRVRGGDEVPYTFRRDLGVLLGAATDPALRPESVAFYQREAAAGAAAGNEIERRQFAGRDNAALGRETGASDSTATARREQKRGG